MENNTCKTCNLNPTQRAVVEQWMLEGLGNKAISRKLSEDGVQISKDSIRRHRDNHMKEEAQTTLLGVVQPPQATARIEMDDEGGEAQTRPYADEENPSELIKDTAQVLREHGIDPEVFEVVGPVRMSRWQVSTFDQVDGVSKPTWYTAYKFRFERKSVDENGELDLPTLFMTVKDRVAPVENFMAGNPDRALVVSFSDPQIGKVDVRGGTEELIERVLEKKEKLDSHIKTRGAYKAVFLDGGDIVEGFENTGQQQFTNDRSIMDQVDLAITLEEQFIDTLAQYYTTVQVAGVPSNHAAWRRGKDYLGAPSDDWGLFSLKQIERLYGRVGGYDHVSFTYPETWSKSVVVDVLGHGVGLTHGDEVNRPEGIPDWWAKQVHGGSPLARAEILVSAHFHTLRIQNCGRTPEGKQKWWLQSPCLDNGSSWYANKAGSDSDPGLLVFEVSRETGFDMQSLTIL